MVFIPVILFPFCLILSFWARKSRKVFMTILTVGCLTFCFALELLLYSQECLLKSAWTAGSLAAAFSSLFLVGYGFLWLFLPIKWFDRVIPLLLSVISNFIFQEKSATVFQVLFWVGIIYYVSFYFRYLLKSEKNSSQKKIQKKQQRKK